MSLLLDALKRAEQEKLARGDRPDLQVVQNEAPPRSAPAAPQPARGDKAANLELQPLAAAPPPPTKSAAQSAQAVFEAKTAAQREAGSRRGVIYAVAGSILVAVVAAGAYVWYAMQSFSPARPAAHVQAPAAPAAGTITPVAPPAAQPVPSSAPAPSTPARLAETLSVQPPAPPPAPPLAPREELMQQLLREQAAREPPLKLDRSQETTRVPAEVAAGYEALRRGDLAGARRSYQSALAADSASVDAALGLATIEARSGNVNAAAAHYRRVLDLDPRNQTAMAGLAALAEASRPGAVEAQLRQDLVAYPQSAPLRLALGNLLAAQARWSEAQGEYFEAHRLDPGNPDIAHNLAVSLDHLGQRRLAADYYRRALKSAREQPAQFDAAPIERRLAELGS